MPLRTFLATVLIVAGTTLPAMADVTHHFRGRFGVSYVPDPNGSGMRAQTFYDGSYTARFTHETDSGVRFRFDLGVVVSNFESPRPRQWQPDSDERR
jgi:hypothetical protein